MSLQKLEGPSHPLLNKIARIWNRIRFVWWFFWATRFSLITILICAALLLATDQGRELAQLIGVPEETKYLWLIITLELFALQAWYWARITMRFSDIGEGVVDFAQLTGKDWYEHNTTWWRKWLPRIYAGSVFLVVLIAMLCSEWSVQFSTLSERAYGFLIILVMGIATIAFLVTRTKAIELVGNRLEVVRRMSVSSEEIGSLGDQSAGMRVILWMSLLSAAFAMVLVSVWSVEIGQHLGATAIAFLACAFIIPAGSYLVILTRSFGVPVILLLFLWAWVSSFLNDNHKVETGNLASADKALSLDSAIENWFAMNPAPDNGDAIPMVIVSTAGGGLRAAYWTTTVLGAIQDRCANFANRTFAISGVSGGSVGATIFSAKMADSQLGAEAGCVGASGQTFQRDLNLVLSEDFLGPTVAAMLFPDLLQRFLPPPFLPSRGDILAESWERAWDKNCDGMNEGSGTPKSCAGRLIDAFLNLRADDGTSWRPLLFLNATHQDSGKRFITSHVAIDQDRFFDAYDSHRVLGGDIPVSMAALNSARFTFVSPPGRLLDENGNFQGRVLDGGYFENFGAVTAAEILNGMLNADLKAPIKPIIIQIASDPDLNAEDYPDLEHVACKNQKKNKEEKKKPNYLDVSEPKDMSLYEIRGPLRGLLKTRSARGVLAAKSLSQMVCSLMDKEKAEKHPKIKEPVFIHFEICPTDKNAKPPLGWIMSQASRNTIEDLLTENGGKCDNYGQFNRVLEELKGN